MVTIRPYNSQTQASSIQQQNSGGNGYIGNAGLQMLGQTIAGVGERALGIDDASIQRQQQQEINRNKFEAEIERREQEQYLQSEKLAGIGKLADLEFELGSETEDLKSKMPSGGQGYAQSVQQAIEKKIGLVQKNLTYYQKQFLEPQLLDLKNKYQFKAKDWERSERIKNDVYNVEKYRKTLYDQVNGDPESVNMARSQFNTVVDNLNVPPEVKRNLLEDFDDTTTQLHYDYRIETDPEGFLNDFKGGGGANFDTAIDYIFGLEGGYVAKDGRSNAPANFGINQKYNPDIDVKNLTKEKAKEIYQERYWNKINGDSLPESIRLIAMDTAVNQGVGVANELIKKSGGDPVKFTELRIQKYRDLNQSENTDHWIKRANKTLKASQERIGGGILERKYAGQAQQIIEKAQKEDHKNQVSTIKLAIRDGQLNYNDIKDNPNISDADKLVYMTAQTRYDTNVSKAEAQASKIKKEQYNGRIEKISQEIDENKWSAEKLDAIRNDLDMSDYDKLKKRIEARDEDIHLSKAINTEPTGSDLHVKAVNHEFDKSKESIFSPSISVAERTQNAVNFFQKSGGVVPNEFKSIVQNMALKPNADNVEFINGVYQNAKLSQDKAVLNNLPDDVALTSKMYQSYLDSGNNPQQALSLLNEDLNITPQKRKERGDLGMDIVREPLKDGKSFIEQYGDINASWLGFFGDDYSNIKPDSDVYSDLEADAKDQFMTAFIKTGNKEQSLEMAFDYIGKTYSKFNGEYMKYAPDVVTGFDADIIEKHFNESVIQNKDVISLSERLGFNINDIKLTINEKTEKAFKTREMTKNGVSFKVQPEYNIVIDNMPVRDTKGNMLVYIPDTNELKQIRQKEMAKEPFPLTLPRG